MSVPTRRGPWWYYTRTEEGKDYAHPLPAPRPRPRRAARRPASPARRSRSCSTRTSLAEGSDYFAVGSAAVSHDHRWLAYSTDRTGDEKYELRFRPLDAERRPAPPPRRCPRPATAWPGRPAPTSSSTSAWTRRSALPAVAPPAGHRPRRRRARLRGGRPALLARHRLDPRHRLRARSACTAPTPPSGSPSPRTTRWPSPGGRPAPPRGRRVRRRPPHAGARAARGWFVALTNDDAQDFRVLAAPDAALGSQDAATWREVVPHRPGVRVEDVDAFAGALVLSERAEAQTQVRVLPLRPDRPAATPSAATCSAPAGSSPRIDSPSSTWLGANPEPDAPVLRIGRTSLVTPSSVLQITSGRPRGDAAQAGARPGRLRRGPLHHLPRVGRRPRRDARPDLRGAPQGPRAARHRASSTATAPTR